ncbi:MAG: hypothetical protein ACRCYM_01270 [Cetobacterium sp.]
MALALVTKTEVLARCYQAVQVALVKRKNFDAKQHAFLAEELAKQVFEFAKAHGGKQPQPVVELTPIDIDNFEILCEILDDVQTSFPIVKQFNVRLNIQRFDFMEDHATPITDSNQGGKTPGLG